MRTPTPLIGTIVSPRTVTDVRGSRGQGRWCHHQAAKEETNRAFSLTDIERGRLFSLPKQAHTHTHTINNLFLELLLKWDKEEEEMEEGNQSRFIRPVPAPVIQPPPPASLTLIHTRSSCHVLRFYLHVSVRTFRG